VRAPGASTLSPVLSGVAASGTIGTGNAVTVTPTTSAHRSPAATALSAAIFTARCLSAAKKGFLYSEPPGGLQRR
jgi:hypothetical protein